MSAKGFFGRGLRTLFWSEFKTVERVLEARENIGKAISSSGERIRSMRQKPDYATEIEGLEPDQKWAYLYERFKWTPEDLAQQQFAVRQGRRVYLVALPLLVVAMLFTLSRLPWIIALLLLGALSLGIVRAAMSVVQLALFEAQIEKRTIIELRDFLGWRDFWRRLVR